MAHDVGEQVADLDIEQQVHDRNQVEAHAECLASLETERNMIIKKEVSNSDSVKTRGDE